jgi:2-polyprenyl-3-methyl-5-hydroxy-6-metoxy-1,4-benzoquinol methylase
MKLIVSHRLSQGLPNPADGVSYKRFTRISDQMTGRCDLSLSVRSLDHGTQRYWIHSALAVDLGGGTGSFLSHLRTYGNLVFGVDSSHETLAEAAQDNRGQGIFLIQHCRII